MSKSNERARIIQAEVLYSFPPWPRSERTRRPTAPPLAAVGLLGPGHAGIALLKGAPNLAVALVKVGLAVEGSWGTYGLGFRHEKAPA